MTMKWNSRITITLAAFALLAAPALAQRAGQMAGQGGANQQQMGQQQAAQQQMAQQQMSQQQLAKMDQTMQRLHQIEKQANQLSQNMARQAGPSGQGQMGIRDQNMKQLCDSVATLARDMTQTMDRIHLQLRDPDMAQDRDMLRDMDRLRLHVEDMVGPMEDALKSMEQIQQRLHMPTDAS